MKNVPKVCASGCSACCHQSVSVFASEGLVLERFISSSLSENQRNAAKVKGEAWLSSFNQISREASLNNPLTEGEFFEAERQITAMRLPCLFLEEDKCTVYGARPLVCRTYSVEDDPQECTTNPRRTVSDRSTKVLLKHFGDFMRLDPVARQRPLVYAVAETLGISVYRKPIVMSARLMSRWTGDRR